MTNRKRLILFRLKIGDHPDNVERVMVFEPWASKALAELRAEIENRINPQYHYWVVT